MASSTLVLLLLLAVALLSVSAEFISIDCGSSDSFTDGNTIKWVGDADYAFSDSTAYTVQDTTGWSREMTTMRVFSGKDKNCYSIKITKGSQYLVRASFLYGNYDKKSAPPSFQLLFDGNLWAVVETSTDLVSTYEVIYIPIGDHIDVCVARTTPNQLPFISAIEIRELDSEMYNEVASEYAMIRTRRVAFGTTEMIRYPSDEYDRKWEPADITNTKGLVTLTNDAKIIDTSVPDQPPAAVFHYAIGASTSTTLSLFPRLPDFEVPIYIILYFTEMSVLDSRSFEVQIDGKSPFNPIVPTYASVTSFSITNITASSKTTFDLVATSGSTLPPLINAMEVYYVTQLSGTKKKSSKIGLIVGLVVGAVFVVAAIVIVALCCVAQSKRRQRGIAAMGAGQYGNGKGLPQGGPMNGQMGGQFGEVMMNQQYDGNVQEQGAPDPRGTPEQFRKVEVEERPIHY